MKEALAARLGEDAGKPQPIIRRFPRRAAAWGAAAAAVVLAALTVTTWRRSDDKAGDFSYVSNTDRPQQVVLADGSFVDLNSHTTIRTQMFPRERRIALQEGEAHFAVAHDASRPFVVEAAGVTIRAIGTAFNVRIRETRVEVLVSEGKVEITDARAGATAAGAQRPQLGAAERAVIPRASSSSITVVEKVDPRELREALSWHSSVTTISSRPLRDIVELFNRRNTLRLAITDAELAERNFGGSFALNQPRAFVRALEIDGDVVSEPRGENEIVLRHRR
ncbi:MAG: FecR domain-containing protein [Opitutaceae bacterium]|nr:FecR domain-containing protein [Opitutaceae bacterium]